jgi:hypothetical protein
VPQRDADGRGAQKERDTLRRQARASSAGSNLNLGASLGSIRRGARVSLLDSDGSGAPAGRRSRIAILAVGVLSLALLCTVLPAGAAESAPELIREFGRTGVDSGQTIGPRGMATNSDTGHLYVTEVNNQRISEFTAWGQFVKSWGWGVVGGGAAGSGDLVAESNVVTSVITTSKIFKVGQTITGAGIPAGTTITAVGAGTITLSQPATESGTSVALTVAAGPNNVPVNEQQTVTLGAGVTAGNFKITYTTPNPSNTTATTANIPYNATQAEVETALATLPNIGAGNVSVTSSNPGGGTARGGPYVVTFGGTRFADTDVAQMTVAAGSPNLTGGTATVATTVSGGNAFEVCTAGCQAGLSGANAGQFANPVGAAVDSLGNIYVVDLANRRVQKFAPDGTFLLMFGGGVNKTTGANVCTKAQLEAGNVCGAGTTGAAVGQFGVWKIGDFIEIDSADTVYVGDVERIQRFTTAGASAGEPIAIAGCGAVESLGVNPADQLWVACDQTKKPGLLQRLNSSGSVLQTIEIPSPKIAKGLALDSDGKIYVYTEKRVGADGQDLPEVLKYDAAGTLQVRFGAGEFTTSTGIVTNSIGDVYVDNATNGNSYIRAYGPLPFAYEQPPAVAPTISAEYATAVGVGSATLVADINPHFLTTNYYVEYGPADCAANQCAKKPVPPATLSGLRDRPYQAEIVLSGLAPGSTYHYRFVAQSAGGGPVIGGDRTFTTRRSRTLGLPDGRAYEMVSPPDKHSGEAARRFSYLLEDGYPKPIQASSSGEAIAFPALAAFGDAKAAPSISTYLSRRTASGWLTENITAPNTEGNTKGPVRGFPSDLGFTAVAQHEPTLAPGAVPGFENLYLRDNGSGEYTALTTSIPRMADPNELFCVEYGGASADSSRVLVSANGALTPDAPDGAGNTLYEWTSAGLRLVSVLPDGTPATPATGTGFGAGRGFEGGCHMMHHFVRHAISADGSRIFWTDGSVGTRLFARVNGTETIQLDATQGGPGPAGGGKFWDASEDGSKVFFTAPSKLTADASANSLYLYDFDAAAPLSSLTPGAGAADVLGVLGASDDGSRVYFVANGVLTSGATQGQPNLYLWQKGEGLRFIATLSTEEGDFAFAPADASTWTSDPELRTGRVSPDGRHLTFLSTLSLTGYDNFGSECAVAEETPLAFGPGRCTEAYIYDAEADELLCASCNPSGARPTGPSAFPPWATYERQIRYLSDDGRRLFFETYDSLAANDSNRTRDVYEFEREGVGSCSDQSESFDPGTRGCQYLISGGTASGESYFLDASADGRDVFFSTPQALVPADVDYNYDVYDARVGGGFAPPAPPASCSGEACRPAEASPASPTPASSGFVGEGNLENDRAKGSRRCPKGKRAVRRRGKTVCIRRHARKRRAGHNRGAAR